MNETQQPRNRGLVLRWLATAGIGAILLAPVSASADHDRPELVDALVGAAVVYAIVDSLDGFDDRRYDGYHRSVRHGYDHYPHRARHYSYHYPHHERRTWNRHHAKHHRYHRSHHGRGHTRYCRH